MKKAKFKKGDKVWVVEEKRRAIIRGEIETVDMVGYGDSLLEALEHPSQVKDLISYEYSVATSEELFMGIPQESIGRTKKEAIEFYQEIWKDAGSWRPKELTNEVLAEANKNILR